MKWSKYSFLEIYKIMRSKIFHTNIVCMAIHTRDLELFEKILRIEKVKDLNRVNFNYCALVKGDKYYNFFQKLNDYFNKKNIILDKEQQEHLNFLLVYMKIFDTSSFTNNEQLQPRYSYEETLEYYERFYKNSTVNHTQHSVQLEVLPELNYAELDWTN